MSTTLSAERVSRPFVLLVVLGVAAVAAALAGVTQPLSATQFANTGHWVYNASLGVAFHIDGATANVDAQLPLDAEPGSQILQSDSTGFAIGLRRIVEFDKATLTEGASRRPPATEDALGLEVLGGPYAVYRETGLIVRLGEPVASIDTGGPIGDPVVTEDGTVWFHRTETGEICRLDKAATEVTGCPVSAPRDHAGALTTVAGRPAFLDLDSGTLHHIDGDTLGQGIDLDVTLSPAARPAAADVDGRLAILDPGPAAQSSLVLVDLDGATATSTATAKQVALGSGEFDGPVANGDVVAVVDRDHGTVLTFGPDGSPVDKRPLRDKTGEPRLVAGEDKRIYVEDDDGAQVLVVAEDGSITDVDLTAPPSDRDQGKDQDSAENADEDADTNRNPNRDSDPNGGSQGPVEAADPGRGGPEPGPDPRGSGGRETAPTPPPVAPSRPGAPVAVTARAGEGSATVSWGPAPENRSPITSYRVSWRGGNGQTGSLTVGGAGRDARIGGLTGGVSYVISVAATNGVGPGPAAAAPPVTPTAAVAPAAPPVGLLANYDEHDAPTRDVTLTWRQPALNGGRLVHYEITAPGEPTKQVKATSVVYEQVEAKNTITFTVRAITRAPNGQTLIGQPATAVHEQTEGVQPQIQLSKGDATEEYCGDSDHGDCAWMQVVLTGFAPNTEYLVMPHNDANDGYFNEGHTTRTDAEGNASFQAFAYTGPGETVWVTTEVPGNGEVTSNQLVW